MLLMIVAFVGIYLYGLLAALPGSVLPSLERNQFLPNDSAIATFLLINAIGAVLAYLVSGPIIDRIGTKFALLFGTSLVILSMVGFALVVGSIRPGAALGLIFGCSLLLGVGANAIVAAGHALVAAIASSWRNAALNLLDICFGLGLASLPLVVQRVQQYGGLSSTFWLLSGITILLTLVLLIARFPRTGHSPGKTLGAAGTLFRQPSFLLLAAALLMYVGTEVSVAKWVVTFMERDGRILANHGLDAARLASMTEMSPQLLDHFFEADPTGAAIASYALKTLTLFAMALLVGRLVSSFVLGVLHANSFLVMTAGSLITTLALVLAFTSNSPGIVRLGLIAAGFGMGPIFPTSVGLASAMMPEIAGTAMSLVMGIGFVGLLIIPPAVGYVSNAVGGQTGDIRTGLMVVMAASIVMFLLHIFLTLRERQRRI